MKNYIIVVIIVFGLLILSRIQPLLNNTASPEIILSTFVEYAFFVWGILVLRKNRKKDSDKQ
ncbi:MAG: hypothetical protein ACOC34_03610 [Thermotogota bacterium]